MFHAIGKKLSVERGQALVEYALILALIAIVSVGVLSQVGGLGAALLVPVKNAI